MEKRTVSRTWVIADPHFGHAGICRFENFDGSPVRPWDDVAEMDDALIKNWNAVVNDADRVYVLGDVAMTKKGLGALHNLKGRKVLVKGNHDQEKLSVYAPFFQDIRAYVVKKGFIMSHIPIHPQSLSRWDLNIHGHLHNNFVKLENGQPDKRYYCASVERIDFTPKLLDDILKERGLV
jgi:calcineurin-like phosphoesterase family protein